MSDNKRRMIFQWTLSPNFVVMMVRLMMVIMARLVRQHVGQKMNKIGGADGRVIIMIIIIIILPGQCLWC